MRTKRAGWPTVVWNPLTGCDKISPACRGCYAERSALRQQADGVKKYANGFRLTLHPDLIDEPKKWRKPRIVFVNSMSDLFHREVPLDFIERVFRTMNACPQHVFQVLTKRSDILVQCAPMLDWTSNIWAGVTVETEAYVKRIDHLRTVPARVRWLSIEPLLGPIQDIDLTGIQWVVVGGESGPSFRQMQPRWVRDIRDKCIDKSVKFHFKQWAGLYPERLGRTLDGRLWDEMPPLPGENQMDLFESVRKEEERYGHNGRISSAYR